MELGNLTRLCLAPYRSCWQEEQQIREEAHRKEMAQLQQRLEEVQAAAMADWQAMEAEARRSGRRATKRDRPGQFLAARFDR